MTHSTSLIVPCDVKYYAFYEMKCISLSFISKLYCLFKVSLCRLRRLWWWGWWRCSKWSHNKFHWKHTQTRPYCMHKWHPADTAQMFVILSQSSITAPSWKCAANTKNMTCHISISDHFLPPSFLRLSDRRRNHRCKQSRSQAGIIIVIFITIVIIIIINHRPDPNVTSNNVTH